MTGPKDSLSSISVRDYEDVIERLFRNGRTNAIIAWLLVAVLVSVFVESVRRLDYQWIVFVGFVGVVVLLPPIVYRERRGVLPSGSLVLALFPILIRAVVGGSVGTFATYLALAAIALIIIVELHMFTDLKVTHWFAVVLVVMTTLATVAVWTIFRWNADQFLGTTYLSDNESLMIEWVYVTVAGIVAGVVFDTYFTRRDRILWRILRKMVDR
ncbi:hypothetical protein [Halanaeroarchaeum sulfurireducens]|uniref:Uncharacterized protein n=1 Tax=Halanaeroarchaeum sulfurireducens TaxID=1604004 RepID=A0A0F7PAQ6_9EURY|nr:hypothetical protein [Halanaeroarchaeum sulfurireducens]AKH97822.1 hypothetical protein HLASF_1336 [Halanaeroarchaeum sulfurireducens]